MTSSVSLLPPADDYTRGFCDGWLEYAAYARATRLTVDDGIAIGWEAAHRAFRNAIAEACHGIPRDAAEVIRQLVRVWDSDTPPGELPNYRGGPATWGEAA